MPNLVVSPGRYHRFHGARYRLLDALLSNEISAGSRVIEFGCEPGHFARLATERNWDYVGVTYHPPDSFRTEFERFDRKLVDANLEERCDLPQNFDYCLALEVIEHLPLSPINLLLNAWSTLRPGGTLILTTPNGARLASRVNAIRGRSVHWPVSATWELASYVRHHREYTRAELKEMLTHAGFGDVSVRGVYQYGDPLKSVVSRFVPHTLLGSLLATARR